MGFPYSSTHKATCSLVPTFRSRPHFRDASSVRLSSKLLQPCSSSFAPFQPFGEARPSSRKFSVALTNARDYMLPKRWKCADILSFYVSIRTPYRSTLVHGKMSYVMAFKNMFLGGEKPYPIGQVR